MSDDTAFRVCSCNRTMSIDAKRLASALGRETPLEVAHELCRKDVRAFTSALGVQRCVVACTQEAPLFREVASEAGASAELVFVNIRELAGWSSEARDATPKIAALLATADLPAPAPLPGVSFSSAGRMLIVGPANAAIDWAERLASDLTVSVLITDARGELPLERAYPVFSGRVQSVGGHLGAFDVRWEQANPIDLELCTRCNACVRACPEQAIDFSYQIDLGKCRSHRACVKACGAIGAIDFAREDRARGETFDLVLDLQAEPALRLARLPQGYLAPGRDPLDQAHAVRTLAALVGEFEKPKYFAYEPRICAHGRSGKHGCTACIDVCSTGAIRSAGEKVAVDAHLCMGCGGCATVCPSGAMTYAYPRVSDLGTRVRRMLGVYRHAGGADALLLFHSGQEGKRLVQSLGRRGRGLPARVLPVEVHHSAAVGLDLMLASIALGAAQVVVLATEADAAGYASATAKQIGFGSTVLEALGYGADRLQVWTLDDPAALERQLWSLAAPRERIASATFQPGDAKRTTLEFAIDHLAAQAPRAQPMVPLAAGAPWGAIEVDRGKCTLCKACVSACPAAAINDAQDAPLIRFIERNCVQCGLCARTCPEDAITLVPRLNLAPAAREAVTLHEDEPFACVRCSKPFGTRGLIERMTAKLGSHPMFASGPALRRLHMCADCRVVDLMEGQGESTIFDVKGRRPQ